MIRVINVSYTITFYWSSLLNKSLLNKLPLNQLDQPRLAIISFLYGRQPVANGYDLQRHRIMHKLVVIKLVDFKTRERYQRNTYPRLRCSINRIIQLMRTNRIVVDARRTPQEGRGNVINVDITAYARQMKFSQVEERKIRSTAWDAFVKNK